MLSAGLLLSWWKLCDFFSGYRAVMVAGIVVVAGWAAILMFQNLQLIDEAGYRFALMGGLTEARFTLLPTGLLIRVLLWSSVVLIVLRFNTSSVLLAGFLVGCLVLMNMQWVTGKNIQPGHWSFGADRIIGWMVILLGVYIVRRYLPSRIMMLKQGILFISVLFFFAATWVSWRNFEVLSRWDAERTEVIEFLNTQPSLVVLVPEIWLETDVLIHTPHYSFIPRGAQSAVSAEEHWNRLTYAAVALGYSNEGFEQWLHTRSVRFFGMLYGTSKEFSSSFYYDPTRREGVLRFSAGQLPDWDNDLINKSLKVGLGATRPPDLLVLHADESRIPGENIVFENNKYRVSQVLPVSRMEWGQSLPVAERKYPLVH